MPTPTTSHMSLLQGFPIFLVSDNKSLHLTAVALCCAGEHKIHFIPGMIGPFLGVTLVPQPEVRNIMIPIFHDMMDWEQRKNGNFKQVKWLPKHLQYPFSCSICDAQLQARPFYLSIISDYEDAVM